MLRKLVLTFFLILSAGLAMAQTSALQRLDTGDDSRAWEAVGRLELDGRGFCTGALISSELVLTAAHCLFDKKTGERIDHEQIQFLAGWRNGRASAYRQIRRAVEHPDYHYDNSASADRVRNDLALLELQHPIRNTRVEPFKTEKRPRKGQQLGVVSYARGRSEAPSLQEVCGVMARQQGVLVMSCEVSFGSSGAPIFSFESGEPRVVSIVSAMAELEGQKVSLGTQIEEPLEVLLAHMGSGDKTVLNNSAPKLVDGLKRRETGAKFAKPAQ